jgi:ABC-type transporter Mla subunit MlaD
VDFDLSELSDRALLIRVLASTTRMEERMSALSDSLDRLSGAVRDKISALEQALADERAAADATAQAEAAEDVQQNQDLADARAATDAALADAQSAVSRIDDLTQEVSGAQGDPSDVSVEPAPDAPADVPADQPADQPADSGEAQPTPDQPAPEPGPEDETTV